MWPAFLAAYGATVSTLLAAIQILRFIEEGRYVSLDISVTYTSNIHTSDKDIIYNVWIMNQGKGPVTLLEAWVGTGFISRKWLLRRLEADLMTSLLEQDKQNNTEKAITLGPGEARLYKCSAIEILRDKARHSTADESKPKTHLGSGIIHVIEIRHSRSTRTILKRLPMLHVSEGELNDFRKVAEEQSDGACSPAAVD